MLVGLGVVLLIVALRGTEPRAARAPRQGDLAKSIKVEHLLVRIAIGVVVGVIVALVTGWPVAAVLLGAVGFLLPTLVGGRAAQLAKIERVEAIAAWAEMLRDTMAGAGGLEQSIIACSGVAPLPIRREVLGLAARLEREKLAPALRDFANELDDPTGDLVVAAPRAGRRQESEATGRPARHARPVGAGRGQHATAGRGRPGQDPDVGAGGHHLHRGLRPRPRHPQPVIPRRLRHAPGPAGDGAGRPVLRRRLLLAGQGVQVRGRGAVPHDRRGQHDRRSAARPGLRPCRLRHLAAPVPADAAAVGRHRPIAAPQRADPDHCRPARSTTSAIWSGAPWAPRSGG